MTFPPRIWKPIAWVLSALNVAAVWLAAQPAEPWHATSHAVLAVLFALWAQRLAARQRPVDSSDTDAQLLQRLDALDRIERTVESTAIEVERISEANRFMSRLLEERRDVASPESRPGR